MRIAAVFVPVRTKTSDIAPEEIALWSLQEHVLRHRTFAHLSDQEFGNLSNRRFQNVGLLSMCQLLRARGHSVTYHAPDSDTRDASHKMELGDADMVLISSYTFNFDTAVKWARQIRAEKLDVVIGIGGHHAPNLPELTLAMDGSGLFDFTIAGYAENSICAVAAAYAETRHPRLGRIPQVSFVDDVGRVVRNEQTNFPSLRRLPPPANDLIPAEVALVSARVFAAYGCPFHCSMCNLGLEKSYSRRPLEILRAELEYLVRERGTRYVYIGDPTLAADMKHFRGLVEVMNSFPTVCWGGQTRLPIAGRRDFAAMIADSQCVHLEVGVESSSQALLDTVKKGVAADSAHDQLYALRKRLPRLHIETNWMFGIPGASRTDLDRDRVTMERLIRDGFDVCLSVFAPFPGTPFFSHPERFGIVIEDRRWASYKMMGPPVFSNVRGLEREELFAIYCGTNESLRQAVAAAYPDVVACTSPHSRKRTAVC